MTEEQVKKAREDAEALIAPFMKEMHDRMVDFYMAGFTDCMREYVSEEDLSLVRLKKDAILQKRLDQSDFSTRLWNTLRAMDVYTLGDIIKHSQLEYMKYRNFGIVCLGELQRYARKYGYEIKEV
jgi:DNA-directed RNA polymerase alpha subunit